MENNELELLKEKYADFIASLSDEDRAKVDACKTVDELLKLINEAEGELPDEVLEAVAGGAGKDGKRLCPFCGSKNIFTDTTISRFRCMDCGEYFDL